MANVEKKEDGMVQIFMYFVGIQESARNTSCFANHIWTGCVATCNITINISYTQDIWDRLENKGLQTRVGKIMVASV